MENRGKGVANERRAIAEGMEADLKKMMAAGLSMEQAQQTILTIASQQAMVDASRNPGTVVIVPSGPTPPHDIAQFVAASAAGRGKAAPHPAS